MTAEMFLQLPIALFISYQVWRISHSLRAFEIQVDNHEKRITKLAYTLVLTVGMMKRPYIIKKNR